MAPSDGTDHLDLQVVLRRPNVNAIILDESLEQVDTLVDQTIPGFAFSVLQRGISEDAPFVEERCARILLTKQCSKSFFKTTPEDHRPSLLFPPSIEVAIPIAARATVQTSHKPYAERRQNWRKSPD